MTLYRKILVVAALCAVVIAVIGVLAAWMTGTMSVLWTALAAAVVVALLALPVGEMVRGSVESTAKEIKSAVRAYQSGSDNVEIASDFPELGAAVGDLAEELKTRARSVEDELSGVMEKLVEAENELYTAREREAKAQEMFEETNKTAQRAFDISGKVSYAAEGLSSQVVEVSQGTQLQRDRVAETATAMEEMNATVLEVARNASDSSNSAENAKSKALEGSNIVQQSVAAIGRVNELSVELKNNLDQLGTQAESIGQVMNVITDIADQTNLLALNAAIEAARAGEAGRGFAVVADEVRKLAEKTMTATKEVGDSIKAIQDATDRNIKSMDLAANAISEATELANQSGESLQEIVNFVEDSAGQAQSIAAASEEQSAASEEINRAIDEVNQVAADTAEGMDAASLAVRELAGLASDLQGLFENLTGADESKLAHSDTEMRGILPKMMVDFVSGKYGPAVGQAMLKEMGNPSFLASRSYPDAVMNQMGDLVAGQTGQTRDQVMYDFGFYTPTEFYKLYRRYFRTDDLKEFYLKMNDTHAELTKEEPGITPPQFTYEDKGDVLIMEYHSSRALFSYFEGILNGVSDMFNTPVNITVRPVGADTARAEIRF